MAIEIDLTDRTAVVTGGSRGIGRATALLLARAGAAVVVNYVSNQDAAGHVVSAIERDGGQAMAYRCDVRDSAGVTEMIAAAEDRFRSVDILVSNAGGGTRFGTLALTDAEFERVLAVNMGGFLSTARAVLPGMHRRRRGSIIAIGSLVGQTGKSFMAPSPAYAGAKAGVTGMVRSMARESAPFDVRVNCVRPAWTDTDATARASEEVREEARKEFPLARAGQPEDVASGVVFLASPLASFITGHTLDVNGGSYMS